MSDTDLENLWDIKLFKKDDRACGYLFNVRSDQKDKIFFYFISADGLSTFRVEQKIKPYFYIGLFKEKKYDESFDQLLFQIESILEVQLNQLKLNQAFQISQTERILIEEEQCLRRLPPGYRSSKFLKLQFETREDMVKARIFITTAVNEAKEKRAITSHQLRIGQYSREEISRQYSENPLLYLKDIFEADITLITRHLIDTKLRCGKWYDIKNNFLIEAKQHPLEPYLRVLAWDIETWKEPLKFPDPAKDPIMCISYMCNNLGYLLINLEHFGHKIKDFEYSPRSDLKGHFKVHNFCNEEELLKFFLLHVAKVLRPHIMVSYNGDFFDFPYLSIRCEVYQISLYEWWGFPYNASTDSVRSNLPSSLKRGVTPFEKAQQQFISKVTVHLDCIKWVERDSYLPCGSRGLKSVVKAKLRYNPKEVDPEYMVPFALSRPQVMAEYSVSDSVATYYLYMQYVHRFTLALASIIPLGPDDVLRKGSGTLCENLLMAEAYDKNVVWPNKDLEENGVEDANLKWVENKYLMISESYIGGQVDQLRAGIFRSDFKEKFQIDESIVDELVEELDFMFELWLKEESVGMGSYSNNWSSVKNEIKERLHFLKERKSLITTPMIYHVDVGAMYPNIILSQRLQPHAIVSSAKCEKCEWSEDKGNCQRHMQWRWKAEHYPLTKPEILNIRDKLKGEIHKIAIEDLAKGFKIRKDLGEELEEEDDDEDNDGVGGWSSDGKFQKMAWSHLTEIQKVGILHQRLKTLSQKCHRKFKIQKEETRDAIICQREHPFYVDTVRAFRDRRLIYKGKKKAAEKLPTVTEQQKMDAKNEILLWDSLQLAHKCILNSFYGYVMRRGARWFSLPMAAVVTYTGAAIIKMAQLVCSGVGICLELDTDGLWVMFPSVFPDNFDIEFYSEGENRLPILKRKLNYPCWMLNYKVDKHWRNSQYYDSATFTTRSEQSVFFEIDGPYKAMFLPSSEKQNQQLKKRYAVYDDNDQIVELKGFEIKRRGELAIIKLFQESIFPLYSKIGKSKTEVYDGVGKSAWRWYQFLESKGAKAQTWEAIADLLRESKTLSKPVNKQNPKFKSVGITTAIRLRELLDDETYIEDVGVKTEYVLSAFPEDIEKTSRAIPVQIFEVEDQQLLISKIHEWTGKRLSVAQTKTEILKEIIDWEYYKTRLMTQIQKLIAIPAISQGLKNPVSDFCILPTWLQRSIETKFGNQKTLPFQKITAQDETAMVIDEEDITMDTTEGLRTENENVDEIFLKHEAWLAKDIPKWFTYQRSVWKNRLRNRVIRKVARVPKRNLNLTFTTNMSVWKVEKSHLTISEEGSKDFFNVPLQSTMVIYSQAGTASQILKLLKAWLSQLDDENDSNFELLSAKPFSKFWFISCEKKCACWRIEIPTNLIKPDRVQWLRILSNLKEKAILLETYEKLFPLIAFPQRNFHPSLFKDNSIKRNLEITNPSANSSNPLSLKSLCLVFLLKLPILSIAWIFNFHGGIGFQISYKNQKRGLFKSDLNVKVLFTILNSYPKFGSKFDYSLKSIKVEEVDEERKVWESVFTKIDKERGLLWVRFNDASLVNKLFCNFNEKLKEPLSSCLLVKSPLDYFELLDFSEITPSNCHRLYRMVGSNVHQCLRILRKSEWVAYLSNCPLGNILEIASSFEKVWDLFIYKFAIERHLILPNAIEASKLSASHRFLDWKDDLQCLGSGSISSLEEFDFHTLRICNPGIYTSHTICKIKFSSTLYLTTLLALPQLSHFYESMEIETALKLINNSNSNVNPIPANSFMLALLYSILTSKILKSPVGGDLQHQLLKSLSSYLLSNQSLFWNLGATVTLIHIWSKRLLEILKDTIHQLSSKIKGLALPLLWMDGMLLAIPTLELNKAQSILKVILETLSKTQIFKQLLKVNSSNIDFLKGNGGVQIDSRSFLFQPDQICLTFLDGLYDDPNSYELAQLVEKTITNYIFSEIEDQDAVSHFCKILSSIGIPKTRLFVASAFFKIFTLKEKDPSIRESAFQRLCDAASISPFSGPAPLSNYHSKPPFLISFVPCMSCGYLDMIDLSARIVGSNGNDDDGDEEELKVIPCIHCRNPHSMDCLEGRLVQSWETSLVSMQATQLVCSKCKNCRKAKLSLYCACGGRYEM